VTPNRQALLLSVYVPTFLLAFGQGMTVPILPLYVQGRFEDSFSLISLVVAASGIGTVIADVPSGILLERIGRKRAMLIGTGTIVLTSIGIALATAYWQLIVLRLAFGVGSALWNISRMTYLTEVTSLGNRGRALSTFGGINRIGTFAGPGVGGLMAAFYGLNTPFYGAALMALGALVVAVLYIHDSSTKASRRGAKMRWEVLGQVARSHWRELTTAGAAQIFAQMIRQGRQIIVPLYGASLGLDVAAIGSIVSISAAIDMSLFIPAGMIMDRFGRKFATVPSFAVMGLGMALIPLAADYTGLLLATGVIGLGNGLSSGTMFTLGADLAPKEAAAEFLGIWRFVGDMGSTGGPVLVGGLADLLGLSAAALGLAFVGWLSAATLATFVKETLSSEPKATPAH
jgi:MFS family permease